MSSKSESLKLIKDDTLRKIRIGVKLAKMKFRISFAAAVIACFAVLTSRAETTDSNDLFAKFATELNAQKSCGAQRLCNPQEFAPKIREFMLTVPWLFKAGTPESPKILDDAQIFRECMFDAQGKWVIPLDALLQDMDWGHKSSNFIGICAPPTNADARNLDRAKAAANVERCVLSSWAGKGSCSEVYRLGEISVANAHVNVGAAALPVIMRPKAAAQKVRVDTAYRPPKDLDVAGSVPLPGSSHPAAAKPKAKPAGEVSDVKKGAGAPAPPAAAPQALPAAPAEAPKPELTDIQKACMVAVHGYPGFSSDCMTSPWWATIKAGMAEGLGQIGVMDVVFTAVAATMAALMMIFSAGLGLPALWALAALATFALSIPVTKIFKSFMKAFFATDAPMQDRLIALRGGTAELTHLLLTLAPAIVVGFYFKLQLRAPQAPPQPVPVTAAADLPNGNMADVLGLNGQDLTLKRGGAVKAPAPPAADPHAVKAQAFADAKDAAPKWDGPGDLPSGLEKRAIHHKAKLDGHDVTVVAVSEDRHFARVHRPGAQQDEVVPENEFDEFDRLTLDLQRKPAPVEDAQANPAPGAAADNESLWRRNQNTLGRASLRAWIDTLLNAGETPIISVVVDKYGAIMSMSRQVPARFQRGIDAGKYAVLKFKFDSDRSIGDYHVETGDLTDDGDRAIDLAVLDYNERIDAEGPRSARNQVSVDDPVIGARVRAENGDILKGKGFPRMLGKRVKIAKKDGQRFIEAFISAEGRFVGFGVADFERLRDSGKLNSVYPVELDLNDDNSVSHIHYIENNSPDQLVQSRIEQAVDDYNQHVQQTAPAPGIGGRLQGLAANMRNGAQHAVDVLVGKLQRKAAGNLAEPNATGRPSDFHSGDPITANGTPYTVRQVLPDGRIEASPRDQPDVVHSLSRADVARDGAPRAAAAAPAPTPAPSAAARVLSQNRKVLRSKGFQQVLEEQTLIEKDTGRRYLIAIVNADGRLVGFGPRVSDAVVSNAVHRIELDLDVDDSVTDIHSIDSLDPTVQARVRQAIEDYNARGNEPPGQTDRLKALTAAVHRGANKFIALLTRTGQAPLPSGPAAGTQPPSPRAEPTPLPAANDAADAMPAEARQKLEHPDQPAAPQHAPAGAFTKDETVYFNGEKAIVVESEGDNTKVIFEGVSEPEDMTSGLLTRAEPPFPVHDLVHDFAKLIAQGEFDKALRLAEYAEQYCPRVARWNPQFVTERNRLDWALKAEQTPGGQRAIAQRKALFDELENLPLEKIVYILEHRIIGGQEVAGVLEVKILGQHPPYMKVEVLKGAPAMGVKKGQVLARHYDVISQKAPPSDGSMNQQYIEEAFPQVYGPEYNIERPINHTPQGEPAGHAFSAVNGKTIFDAVRFAEEGDVRSAMELIKELESVHPELAKDQFFVNEKEYVASMQEAEKTPEGRERLRAYRDWLEAQPILTPGTPVHCIAPDPANMTRMKLQAGTFDGYVGSHARVIIEHEGTRFTAVVPISKVTSEPAPTVDTAAAWKEYAQKSFGPSLEGAAEATPASSGPAKAPAAAAKAPPRVTTLGTIMRGLMAKGTSDAVEFSLCELVLSKETCALTNVR